MVSGRHNSYEASKGINICCCPGQAHLTDQSSQILTMHPEWWLQKLPETFKGQIEGKHITDIREFFQYSDIPFRRKMCVRGNMACCGSCMRECKSRCAQDVLNRAYLFCASIIHAPSGFQGERYKSAETSVQLLYSELISDLPKYFVIAEMIMHMISPIHNKKLEREIAEIYGNEDSPQRLNYAPTIEYELVPGTKPEEQRWRKKVNVESGEVSILHWPRSGMCPFCLPTGLSERRRKLPSYKPGSRPKKL